MEEKASISMRNSGTMNGLVDTQRGTISREIFVNEEIYQREQEQVFGRAWLFVGHDSQIQKPGDYFISSMGEESVILCRDRNQTIHVFLNSCRHRGMKVCRYDEGNTPVFTCPYHGWSYDTDGKLVGVPYFKDAYHEKLDKSKWGLVEVAQIHNYKGSIWATWDRAAPSFLEYIGGFSLYLDLLFDSWDGQAGGTEVFGGVEKWVIPCNWKFPSENFIGDRYHGISHCSVDMVGIGPSGNQRRDTQERIGARALDVSFPDHGHGTIAFLRPDDSPVPAYQDSPVVAEYFAYCEEQRRQSLGKLSRVIAGPGTVFPQHVLPPQATEIHCGLASKKSRPDGGMALVLGRPGLATGGQGVSAAVLHPVLGAGGPDRARRHGELELRPLCQPGCDCAAPSVQLRNGLGTRQQRLPRQRHQAAGNGSRCD